MSITVQCVLTGLYSAGQDGSLVLGRILVNQVTASSRWSPPSVDVTFRRSRGTHVGNITQRLCPMITLFHALVPRGSIWIPVPERAGPITNHLSQIEESNKNCTYDICIKQCVTTATIQY